jgi:hypothetical protein
MLLKNVLFSTMSINILGYATCVNIIFRFGNIYRDGAETVGKI